MKKVTMTVGGYNTPEGVGIISGALNNLSGVVAADVLPSEGVAYAYSGDRLDKNILENAVKKAGYKARVIKEEYLNVE